MCLFFWKKKIAINPELEYDKAELLFEKAANLTSDEELYTLMENTRKKFAVIELSKDTQNIDKEIYVLIENIHKIMISEISLKRDKIVPLLKKIEAKLQEREAILNVNSEDINDFQIEDGNLIKYLGNKETVKLPYSIKVIKSKAFYNNDCIKRVIINRGVTLIEDEAFALNESLREVQLPSTIATIGQSAFYNCRALTRIVFNGGLANIEYYAFARCESLKVVNLPLSVKVIKDKAFEGCKSLDGASKKRIKKINKKAL